MDKATFNQYISMYGSRYENWPNGMNEAASAFARANPEFVTDQIKAEAKFDQLLDAGRLNLGDDLLKERIAATLKTVPQDYDISLTHAPKWRSMAAMVITAFCVGMIGGNFLGQNNIPGPQDGSHDAPISQTLVADAEQTEYLGLSDFYDWVAEDS